jgi:DNA processing protein
MPLFTTLPDRVPPGDAAADLSAWLRLAYTHGIGPARGVALLRHFQSPSAIFDASFAEVRAVVGSPRIAEQLLGSDPTRGQAVMAALAWRDAAADRRLVVLADDDYPARLLDLPDPPLVLHVAGDFAALRQPQIAIVGSRQASAGGLDTAHDLAAALARHGYAITSGLAEGIDAAAHRGALDAQGRTLAALGTGIDQVYPPNHGPLARRIRLQGLLITELALGAPALAAHFPRRNRLIAALSQAVIVVEAALRSGSLITARLAGDLGREVLAVPGSIHAPRARGCHRLLRDGAALVETVDDVLGALGAPGAPGVASAPKARLADPADPPEVTRLLSLLATDPVHLDRLAAHLDQPVSSVLAMAQTLELQGRLQRLDDGRFSLR